MLLNELILNVHIKDEFVEETPDNFGNILDLFDPKFYEDWRNVFEFGQKEPEVETEQCHTVLFESGI